MNHMESTTQEFDCKTNSFTIGLASQIKQHTDEKGARLTEASLVDLLAADDGHMDAVQKLLGDNGCQTAEQVAATVNDDLFARRLQHLVLLAGSDVRHLKESTDRQKQIEYRQ